MGHARRQGGGEGRGAMGASTLPTGYKGPLYVDQRFGRLELGTLLNDHDDQHYPDFSLCDLDTRASTHCHIMKTSTFLSIMWLAKTLAAPRASLTLPSCSPNYPRASRIGWTHARLPVWAGVINRDA